MSATAAGSWSLGSPTVIPLPRVLAQFFSTPAAVDPPTALTYMDAAIGCYARFSRAWTYLCALTGELRDN